MTITFKQPDSKHCFSALARTRVKPKTCFPARHTCKTHLGGASCRVKRYPCRRKRKLVIRIALAFDEDAYGNLLNMEASEAATSLLYSGEFTDVATGQQYLRARFYDPTNGRFNRLDDFAGNANDPRTLHKYAYAHVDPINGIDPTGMYTLSVTIGSVALSLNVSAYAATTAASFAISKGLQAGYLAWTGNLGDFQWIDKWDALNFVPGAAWLRLFKYPFALVQKVPGGASFIGRQFAKQGHIKMAQAFGRQFPNGWNRTLSNGTRIYLKTGRDGFRHLIERHLPQFFNGTNIANTTLWPAGTSGRQVLSYLDEAITSLGNSIPTGGLSPPTTLSNGITVRLFVAPNGRIASFYPEAGAGVTKAIDILNAL